MSLGNLLLSLMPSEAYGAIRPYLRHATLPVNAILSEADTVASNVHFLVDGVAVQYRKDADSDPEVAIIGREGMSGVTPLLDDWRSPYQTTMQVSGSSMQISTFALSSVLAKSENLRSFLLQYIHIQELQSQAIKSQAARNLQDRTALLLLMCHDRIDGDLMPVSHSMLGWMLGVDREALVAAIRSLEQSSCIRATRGWIEIRDRALLESLVGAAYGMTESEYSRRLGQWPEPQTQPGG